MPLSPRGLETALARKEKALAVYFITQVVTESGEGNGNPLQCSCLENPRDGSLVDCRLWGCTEWDTTETT